MCSKLTLFRAFRSDYIRNQQFYCDMKAYVFPGQGSQFTGMGREIFENSVVAKSMMLRANDILGFDLVQVMFEGSDDELKQTNITQPAIFLHSVSLAAALGENFRPAMVAGHSLGEISALVANQTIAFEDGLTLVYKRAMAMQKACEMNPSTMAAILGLEDPLVEKICSEIEGIVVAANYNCPGQLVISGENEAIEKACAALSAAGAKRALKLPVGGAFHSPLMEPARAELADAISNCSFKAPICPIYQNVNASPTSDPGVIKDLLIQQLTAPVRWTQTMENMLRDGCSEVVEVGPGKVLQGLFKKINRDLPVTSAVVEQAPSAI
jgi:[acyl-carrier-protein] S-malonyltransferase